MWSKILSTKRKPLLWIVSGPSGSGKTTLCRKLLQKKELNITRSVSFTTRPKRKGEKNNKDYIFVSRQEFLKKRDKAELIEWQEVFGNLYGTPKKLICDLLSKNRDVLLSIDVKGALQIKRKFPKQAVFIFVLPPNEKKLIQRIKLRAQDDKMQIGKRLKRAKLELSFVKEYDYIIVNDELSKAIKAVESIIIAKRSENVLCPIRKNYR